MIAPTRRYHPVVHVARPARAHVVGRAQTTPVVDSLLRSSERTLLIRSRGPYEVGILAALDQEDVLRLEIAMDDPCRCVAASASSTCRTTCAARPCGIRPPSAVSRRPGYARAGVHHDEQRSVGACRGRDVDDVLVSDRRGRARLALEAPMTSLDLRTREQHLHGHALADQEVLGLVDRAIAAGRDVPLQLVLLSRTCPTRLATPAAIRSAPRCGGLARERLGVVRRAPGLAKPRLRSSLIRTYPPR